MGRRWWSGRRNTTGLDPRDPTLIVIAESYDPAEASSAVLGALEWPDIAGGDIEVVLRHFLLIPPDNITQVRDTAAQDNYVVVDDQAAGIDRLVAAPAAIGRTPVALARAQRIDPMHCSQERSRMAGLAARHGGDVVGWQVLLHPSALR